MKLKHLDGVPKVGDRVYLERPIPNERECGWYTVEWVGLYEDAVVLKSDTSDEPTFAYCHELHIAVESNMETKYVALAMMYGGGGFVSKLGWALMHADLDNAQRIIDAFPEYIQEYTSLAKAMRINEETPYYKTYEEAMKRLFGRR